MACSERKTGSNRVIGRRWRDRAGIGGRRSLIADTGDGHSTIGLAVTIGLWRSQSKRSVFPLDSRLRGNDDAVALLRLDSRCSKPATIRVRGF